MNLIVIVIIGLIAGFLIALIADNVKTFVLNRRLKYVTHVVSDNFGHTGRVNESADSSEADKIRNVIARRWESLGFIDSIHCGVVTKDDSKRKKRNCLKKVI